MTDLLLLAVGVLAAFLLEQGMEIRSLRHRLGKAEKTTNIVIDIVKVTPGLADRLKREGWAIRTVNGGES